MSPYDDQIKNYTTASSLDNLKAQASEENSTSTFSNLKSLLHTSSETSTPTRQCSVNQEYEIRCFGSNNGMTSTSNTAKQNPHVMIPQTLIDKLQQIHTIPLAVAPPTTLVVPLGYNGAQQRSALYSGRTFLFLRLLIARAVHTMNQSMAVSSRKRNTMWRRYIHQHMRLW